MSTHRTIMAEPIKLHPDNPHYFLFRGCPTVLITSAEHYGAVVNLDFDYIAYLDELAAKGLNHTRLFTAYCESEDSIPKVANVLAPAPGRLICPWARSSTPGYANGGNKFDLTQWDAAFFTRLKDFVAQAGSRGIVVEVTLFSVFYGADREWRFSPLRSTNNINGVGDVDRFTALTLENGSLLAVQEAYVRKMASELRDADNIVYEICNEPYVRRIDPKAGGASDAWQAHISGILADEEKRFLHKHLQTQNIENGSSMISNANPNVSVFNWHYCRPPDAVAMNYGLNKVIGNNETGFDGNADVVYRRQGWDFILAGGALFNSLDWSFTAEHEDGSAVGNGSAINGGGSPALRSQLKILLDFMNSFRFVDMAPNNGVVKGGVPPNATARALVEAGRQYAIYVNGGISASLVVELPAGAYRAEWVNTRTGAIDAHEAFSHDGGNRTLVSPNYNEDIALRIKQAAVAAATSGLVGGMAALPLMGDAVKSGVEHPASAERWGVFEIVLTGPNSGNPYVDVSLGAAFTQGAVTRNVTGFYDGGDTYRIRFMPDTLGSWSFTTTSSSPLLNGRTGSFTCTAARAGNHGPMRVHDRYHFQYEDGTPFFHVGTTSYNWLNQTAELQAQTLETLGRSGFNKLRFLIMPKYYDFNKEPPAIWPYAGGPNAWDFDRPNYAFFQNHDQGIRRLWEMGIEADVIICNPYDGWGLKDIKDKPDQMNRYVKYLLARFSAYRNVWWSMANEYQLWSTDDSFWDSLFQLVRDNDPYGRLRSIHNMFQVYDHTKPWVTHASLQEQPRAKTPINFMMDMSRELREKYGKPVVWDEVKYEGNLPTKPDYFWGRMTPEEMTQRFWIGAIHGAYVGHSETYMHPQNIIWWGKGGVLHGGSPARIAFLRRFVEQHVPGQTLEPIDGDASGAHHGTACLLYYHGTSTATNRYFSLPAGIRYRATVVDTWNMTETDAGLHAGTISLAMPAVPHLATFFEQAGTAPPPDETFVKGINFNGGAVTIDGNLWTAHAAALSSGLTETSAIRRWSGAVTPSPAVGTDLQAMLNTAIWQGAPGFGFSQQVENGAYNIYLWVMENFRSNIRSFRIQLNGATVADAVGTQVFGAWVKYGPYAVTVSDGVLAVQLQSNIEAPHVMGMAIFKRTVKPRD